MTKEEFDKKKSSIMAEKWKDPEYRAKMVAKQKALGYRQY